MRRWEDMQSYMLLLLLEVCCLSRAAYRHVSRHCELGAAVVMNAYDAGQADTPVPESMVP